MSVEPNKRANRVAHTLQHALSALLVAGLRDPRIGLVTITEVRMTDDLRSARVYVSAYGDEKAREASLAGLSAAATYLRRQVSTALGLRFAPMLHFLADETLLHAQRLESLLHAASTGQTEVPQPSDGVVAAPKVFVPRQDNTTMAGTPLAAQATKDSPRGTLPSGMSGGDEAATGSVSGSLAAPRHAAEATTDRLGGTLGKGRKRLQRSDELRSKKSRRKRVRNG